jgi:hypothetical protein
MPNNLEGSQLPLDRENQTALSRAVVRYQGGKGPGAYLGQIIDAKMIGRVHVATYQMELWPSFHS